ncbi:MAG: DUF3108 domain-containing protein [Methylotenera sp.]|nr:DUF3108 domain-containing protein [Methylotenera sp.]
MNNKALLLALVASLLLHFLLIAKFQWHIPNLDKGIQRLDVRLVALPASSPVIQAVEQPKSIVPLPEPIVSETVAMSEPPEKVESPASLESLPLEQQVVSQATAVGQVAPKRPETTPYQYVETTFDVKLNSASKLPNQPVDANENNVVRAVFRIDKNGTYMLTTHIAIANSEDKNLANLNDIRQMSEGVVTQAGLVPSSYIIQKQGDSNGVQHIRFVWKDAFVQFKSANLDKVEPLVAGTLDELSALYQFMFLPPVERAQINVASEGTQVMLEFSVKAEEEITTAFGNLRTLHLIKTNSDGHWQDLWLAIDYQYLPVKMIKVFENGETLEFTLKNMLTTAF